MQFGVHVFPTGQSFQPAEFARAVEESAPGLAVVLGAYAYTRAFSYCAGSRTVTASLLLANL